MSGTFTYEKNEQTAMRSSLAPESGIFIDDDDDDDEPCCCKFSKSDQKIIPREESFQESFKSANASISINHSVDRESENTAASLNRSVDRNSENVPISMSLSVDRGESKNVSISTNHSVDRESKNASISTNQSVDRNSKSAPISINLSVDRGESRDVSISMNHSVDRNSENAPISMNQSVDRGESKNVSISMNQSVDRGESENISTSMNQSVDRGSMDERLNSTSMTDGMYFTPLMSPELGHHENADEIHEAVQKMRFNDSSMKEVDENDDDSSIKEPDENDDWMPIEKSSERNWSSLPLIEEIELSPTVVAENSQIEYTDEATRPENLSEIQAESTTHYEHLAADLLMSIVESHRDALNEQKIILTKQTEAINRLAEAIELQTKIIGEARRTDWE